MFNSKKEKKAWRMGFFSGRNSIKKPTKRKNKLFIEKDRYSKSQKEEIAKKAKERKEKELERSLTYSCYEQEFKKAKTPKERRDLNIRYADVIKAHDRYMTVMSEDFPKDFWE